MKFRIENPPGFSDFIGMTALTTEALRLSPTERLKLIEEVWESLAADPASFPVSAEELDELQRRRDRYHSDSASLVDWHEMKSRLFRDGDAP
jgi:putative addiction module component (TIGR02574 family)